MVYGKRPWRKDFYLGHMGIVNTFVNSEEEIANNAFAVDGWLVTRVGVPGRIRTSGPVLRRNPGCTRCVLRLISLEKGYGYRLVRRSK